MLRHQEREEVLFDSGKEEQPWCFYAYRCKPQSSSLNVKPKAISFRDSPISNSILFREIGIAIDRINQPRMRLLPFSRNLEVTNCFCFFSSELLYQKISPQEVFSFAHLPSFHRSQRASLLYIYRSLESPLRKVFYGQPCYNARKFTSASL